MNVFLSLLLSLVRPVQLPCRDGRSHVRPQHGLRCQSPERLYREHRHQHHRLIEKDSEKQVSAGGLTKYMTIALVLTNYADQLDNTFTMPFAISDYVHNTDNADMRSGETFTYREALYAMVTRNANEAAMGLAYELSGGDLAGWVSQMNTLSQRIGTTNSTWTDACGLDSGNTTTAVDMYLILRYLMSFDAFKEISAAPTFTMPAKEKHAKSFVLLSQNVALNKTSGGRFYRSAMQGGMCDVMAYKNDSGDQSYVSWANKDGATYIFCIMQSPDTCDDYGYSNRRPALYETTRLIDWVFESFSIQAALDTDQALAEIPVKYSSDTDTLQLYPADSMMTLLPSTGDGSVTQKYFHLPDYVCAPIRQGRRGGHRGAEAGGRDHRRGGPDRRAGCQPEPAAVTVAGSGVSGQSVPQSCNNIEYYFHHHLLCVGPFEQLEPPQAHQKDPPPLSFAPFSRILWKSDAKSPVSLFRMTGLLVAPAGVEPTMGESKSPALPLGDGASCKILYHILCFSTRGRFHFSAFAAALCRLLQPAICEKPFFSS